MRALVYQGAGKKAVEERPVPEITAPADGVIKMVETKVIIEGGEQ